MPNYTSDLVADKITKRLWNNLTGGGMSSSPLTVLCG